MSTDEYERGYKNGRAIGLRLGRCEGILHVLDEIERRVTGLQGFQGWPEAIGGASTLEALAQWIRESAVEVSR